MGLFSDKLHSLFYYQNCENFTHIYLLILFQGESEVYTKLYFSRGCLKTLDCLFHKIFLAVDKDFLKVKHSQINGKLGDMFSEDNC